MSPPEGNPQNAFEKLASEPRTGFFTDVLDFMRHSKRWWIPPIVIVFILFGAIVALGASGGAPFLYTLF